MMETESNLRVSEESQASAPRCLVDTDVLSASDDGRQRAAAEVLELGQALFDTVIEAAAAPPAASDGDTEREPFPLEEARAAADQFFAALRMLLGI